MLTIFCAQVCKDTPAKIAAFRKEMEPLRQTLRDYKWLGGEQIDYADIAVAGMFLVCLPFQLHRPWITSFSTTMLHILIRESKCSPAETCCNQSTSTWTLIACCWTRIASAELSDRSCQHLPWGLRISLQVLPPCLRLLKYQRLLSTHTWSIACMAMDVSTPNLQRTTSLVKLH